MLAVLLNVMTPSGKLLGRVIPEPQWESVGASRFIIWLYLYGPPGPLCSERLLVLQLTSLAALQPKEQRAAARAAARKPIAQKTRTSDLRGRRHEALAFIVV